MKLFYKLKRKYFKATIKIRLKYQDYNMKKKLLELLKELKNKLQDSKKMQSFYSERQAGYTEGYEQALEEVVELLNNILPANTK